MKIEKKLLFKIGLALFLLFLAIYHWPDITGLPA